MTRLSYKILRLVLLTSDSCLATILVPLGEALHETLLFHRQRYLVVNLLQQLVHAAFLGLLALLIALFFELLAALPPALEEVLLLPAGRRWRFFLETGVALGKIIAEQRFLAAAFENEPFLLASREDEIGQEHAQHGVEHEGRQQHEEHDEKAGEDRVEHRTAITEPGPQRRLEHAAAVEREADEQHIEQEQQPAHEKKPGQEHHGNGMPGGDR